MLQTETSGVAKARLTEGIIQHTVIVEETFESKMRKYNKTGCEKQLHKWLRDTLSDRRGSNPAVGDEGIGKANRNEKINEERTLIE